MSMGGLKARDESWNGLNATRRVDGRAPLSLNPPEYLVRNRFPRSRFPKVRGGGGSQFGCENKVGLDTFRYVDFLVIPQMGVWLKSFTVRQDDETFALLAERAQYSPRGP